jgi:hypothetical protein
MSPQFKKPFNSLDSIQRKIQDIQSLVSLYEVLRSLNCLFKSVMLLLQQPHQQVDLTRYTEMVHGAELGAGGPDLLGPVYAPRGNIRVHSPYLEVSAFNPRSRAAATGRKQDKRG